MIALAHTFNKEKDNVEGYWVQPKLDGIRATFDGENLLTRTGKKIHAPTEWLARLRGLVEHTGETVDGELVTSSMLNEWFWRDEDEEFRLGHNFNDLASVVRSKKADDRWDEVWFYAFDTVEDSEEIYCNRYELLWSYPDSGNCPTFIAPVLQVITDGYNDVSEELKDDAIENNLEGYILRNPRAVYQRKRTRDMLKIKSEQDREVEVIRVIPGTGKHEGRMGALLCHMGKFDNFNDPIGQEFKVGTGFTNAQRELDDWLGKIITVEYSQLTPRGVPRHPRFKAVRDYD